MPNPHFTRRHFLRNVVVATGLGLTGCGGALPMTSRKRFPVTDHCDGRRFFNPRYHTNRSWLDVLRWKMTSRPTPWPDAVAFTRPDPLPPAPRDGTLAAVWINHATVLLQTRHGNLLTDPVFSERVSPVAWAGPARVHAPGLALADLPPIDAILLSHDHYDHCDLTTLRHFATQPRPPEVITPLGNGELARAAGFAAERVIELDWWEAHELVLGLHVRATPARHWSNRLTGARNGRLWSGFFVHAGGRTVYYAGDTAWDDEMFEDIRRRCGAPDLALLPIGAYEPRWFMAEQHCNPAEAVRIHQTVGAQRSIGVHWGTFQLTDEAREDPVRALEAARKAAGLTESAFVVLEPGGRLAV